MRDEALSAASWLEEAIRSPIEPFSDGLIGGEQSVYLSPHHDDVCFSLGALLARRPGGRLVSLFTRSGYAPNPPAGPSPGVDEVTRFRALEDRAFAEISGLTKRDLGLIDAPLLGRVWSDLSHVKDDREALRRPLLDCLQEIAAAFPSNATLGLFCPAGIGGHVNHVATMQTVVELMPILARRYRVVFYEDLPYASSVARREAGLLRLFAAHSGQRGRRLTFPFGKDAALKLALVRLYQSQFSEWPEGCQRFSPKVAGAPTRFHEAVWDFGDPSPNPAGDPFRLSRLTSAK